MGSPPHQRAAIAAGLPVGLAARAAVHPRLFGSSSKSGLVAGLFPGPDVADARGFLDNIRAFQPLAFSVNVSWEGSLQALARDMHSRAAGPDGWEAALLTKLPCSGGPTLHGCGQLFGTLAVYHSDGKRPPLSLSLSLMMVLGLLRQADRQSCLENRC